MKYRSLYIFAISIILSIGIISCKDASPVSNEPISGPFVAKVDGTQFTANDKLANAKFVTSTKMLQIIGQTSGQVETISLSLMTFGGVSTVVDLKPGTYDFDPANIAKYKYLVSASYTKYDGSEYINYNTKWDYVQKGKLIIESNTGTHIKGTFYFDAIKQNNSDGSFDASNIKQITEGAFDLDINNY